MPAPDWTFLAEISLWQVAVVIIAMWILWRIAKQFWPGLKKFIAFVGALNLLPTFLDETKVALAETSTALAEQSALLAQIKHEVLPNNGGSLRDAVDKQGVELSEMNKKLKNDDDRIEALEKTLPRDELGRFTKKE